jgi:spore maturation protein CgeB
LEFDEMVATFAESRINLNLTAASNDPRVPRYVRGVLNRTYPPLLQRLGRGLDQIKGRTYEIPACGGFQLSSRALGVESQFEPGREIVLFDSAAEMVELAKRYLANEGERSAIATAGHERVLRDHTYVHRFSAIFSELGLVT